MIRFLFRFFSMLALAVAVVMAVLDATRSIAASELVMTPLAASWAATLPETLEQFQTFATTRLHPLVWDPVAVSILALPGFAVFAGLALIFFIIGRKPPRRPGEFAVGH